MGKSWNFKILLITLDNVLGMAGHSFATVERHIPTFTCDTMCDYYNMKFKNYYYHWANTVKLYWKILLKSSHNQ